MENQAGMPTENCISNSRNSEMNTSSVLGIDIETVRYINERSKNLIHYSDKLSTALIAIDKYFEIIGPKAGIKFTDSEPFYEENNVYVGKVRYHLSVRKEWGLYAFSSIEEVPNSLIIEMARPVKKAAIKRLPEFLRLYAAKLEELEKEYKEISEQAEKMAGILAGGEVA